MVTLTQFDWPLIATVITAMVLAGFVHGALGLGFPLVATPIAAVFLDVRTAILLTLLPTLAVNFATIAGSVNYKESVRSHATLIILTLLGSLVGAYLLAILDPNPFRLVLAALICLFLWTSRLNRIPSTWLRNNVVLAMAGFGLLAGLSAGTTNVMVAILIIFFLALETPRPVMVPVLNTCFATGKIAQIIVLAAAGLVSFTLLLETAPLALIAVLALKFGQRVQAKIPVATYRKALHVLLAGLAVTLVVQFSLSHGA